ncbi:GntR family transcriptional regulator [Actinophytocola algeriensis]|uniref:DNA-binding transcriptional regulator YhcF (GntR family) n=1 Tax=Actinophytocola algeriensis TaxID=1768010 RepID=A0A7W7Q4B7_9PSEU|nr:GntR family transcriptional regulator [Actinophytocola algeriensis]MBB4906637.1 DNA-binding transcriptional regulator YhcF (GntR family) [Actinophytocola algeriensis]MBE1478118.1 DNA-binding transcriptional regulator YhcF (GntR family) [Actinophytocola algeriensis]
MAGHPSVSGPRITVDPESGVAPWRQVRDQLMHLVRVGALPVGARLPAIRQLAGDLGLAAGTVARVYRELEADGVLRTARRQGTVVASVPAAPGNELALAAAAYVARAVELGADPHTAAAAVFAAWPSDR